MLQPCQQGRRREQADACCREFDGQGQAIQAPADFGDRRGAGVVDYEPRAHGLGAGDEKLYGLVLRKLFWRRWWFAARQSQRHDGVLMLRQQVQGCAAGGQDLQSRTGTQPIPDDGRGCQEVLEVIHDEQGAPVPQPVLDGFRWGAPTIWLDVQHACHHRGDQCRIRQGRQRYEVDAIRKGVTQICRSLESQTRLARSTRSGERQQLLP